MPRAVLGPARSPKRSSTRRRPSRRDFPSDAATRKGLGEPCYGVEHSGAGAMHLHTVRSLAFSGTVSSPILIGSTEDRGMPQRSRRAYDHRIKEQIIRAGNPDLLPALEIPRSTARRTA